MPNIMALGIDRELIQVLTDLLVLHLPHEKPEDVVITWKPNDKIYHRNAVIRASDECTERTVAGVEAACIEAGIKPSRFTDPYRSGKVLVTGFALPDFIEEATRRLAAEISNNSVTLFSQDHYSATNLLGENVPYAEVVAPVSNWTGFLPPDNIAGQIAEAIKSLCDIELFLHSGMKFLTKAA